ncbi:MAG: hypothetical protein B6I37_02070 [Desulfobacteraceae bacterium 4572_35.2]|nr:MAG: hypothetical protein B6I37_02070 [Desulfobacteraceae bacterium 4572_35.2]
MVKETRKVLRTCIACRATKAQETLVRYVLAPDGSLLVDYQHKLPGRGSYTCLNKKCMTQAVQRKAFSRSLKNAQLNVDVEQLISSLQEQVTARVLNLIGMARKASLVSSGSQLVISSLKNPRDIAWVLMAKDITQGVGSKVRERTMRANVPLIECFDKAAIGQALGLSERSVLALMKSPLAQSLNQELQRYMYVMGEL